MASLAERVHAILDIESGPGPNPFNCVWEEPSGPRGKNMTTFEMTCAKLSVEPVPGDVTIAELFVAADEARLTGAWS